MSIDELRQLCVEAFPLSGMRDGLMKSLEGLCASLSGVGIVSEVWVDGSFLTQKIDPQDVDLAVRISAQSLPSPTPQQHDVLTRITQRLYPQCDSYLFFDYPPGHPQYAAGDMMRAYWQRQFGFSRGNAFKGIAVVVTPL